MSIGRRALITKLAGIFPGLGLLSLEPSVASHTVFKKALNSDIKMTYTFTSVGENLTNLSEYLNKVYGSEVQNYIQAQLCTGNLKHIERSSSSHSFKVTFVFANRQSLETFTAGINSLSDLQSLGKLRDQDLIKVSKTIS